MVLRVTPSNVERSAGAVSFATIEQTSRCIRMEGALILEDIIDPGLIVDVRENFVQRYSHYLDGQNHDDALQVGDRRLMITLDLEPPFERRELLANQWLLPILSAAFEDDFVLGAYGMVCSLPAAPSQRIHQDGGDIFPQAALNRLLPLVAVTVGIPLIEMNQIHGTTALWLGSHRDETLAATEISEEPIVREGSCVLWDYRLRHAGTPNRGVKFRPLLYMMYCRPWFVDHKNYQRQAPLRAPKQFLDDLPTELRRLLVRAQEC